MISGNFTTMDFRDAVYVSPKVVIHKGDLVPFVEMASVETGNRKDAKTIEFRKYSGGAKFEKGDTVIASIEPCLQHGKSFYFSEYDKGAGSTEFLVFRGVEGVTTNQFVYYFMMSYEIRAAMIRSMKGATGRQRVDPDVFDGMRISLPDIQYQTRIASILSNYDSAIANCRRQIALLEEAAMRLYREWFKDGKGEKVKLTDLADITYGYPFESRLFNTKKLGRPIVRIRNVPIGQSQDYTTEVAKDMYLVHDGDLLIGMDGEFHMNFWSGGDAWLVQRTCKLAPKDKCHSGFIAEAIRAPIKAFQSAIVGSTVGHLGKADIDTIEIPCPEVEKSKRLQVGFETRVKLRQQIRALTEARDRLLPKLMKGEIAV